MKTRKHHYHGKTVRGLYLALAISLLLTLPWQWRDEILSVPPVALAIVAILIAGYLSRSYQKTYYISVVASILFLVYFQRLALQYFAADQWALGGIMQFDMVLMVLVAYYSIRTTYAWEDSTHHDSPPDDYHYGEKK